MKDFIEKSGLTASQFAKKYDIPYNTVRQWAEGIRKAPAWIVRLFEAERAYKPLIDNKIYYVTQTKTQEGFADYRIFDNKDAYATIIKFELSIQDLTRKSIKGFIVEFKETLIESKYEGGKNEI